jgi:hypothetical protein
MALRITSGTTPGWIEVDENVVEEVKDFVSGLLPKGIVFGNLDLKVANLAQTLITKGAAEIKLPTGATLKFKLRR